MLLNLTKSIASSIGLTAAVTIDERSLLPISTVLIVGSGIWYLSSKLQKLQDGQDEINRRIDTLPCSKCPRE